MFSVIIQKFFNIMAEDIARLLNVNSPDRSLVTSLLEDYLLTSDESDNDDGLPVGSVSDHDGVDDDHENELQMRNTEPQRNSNEIILTEDIDEELKKCQEFR